ncbi:unnamed protein product [Rhizoctonia solani]|uniref:Carbohydrate kinase PfkB domain-containing protein n=1 Tax=Rhizoctonia solani TaxID=456999 RepID=A0A8H3HN68_9AGAM|nr:unnamed protein product [Rhizoctonia solani]
MPKHLASLGLFILDEFEFLDATGKPTGKAIPTQIGGGTYTAIGARIWWNPLPASEIGQIVDRGTDFPASIQQELDHYGSGMWYFRDQPKNKTTRAVNRYMGELRDFDYLTPRIRLTPKDLLGTPLESPRQIHFVCSPTRAAQIMHDVDTFGPKDWEPFTIYEPIPICCVPEELPALKEILYRIDILSPNAGEALGLLSIDKAGVDDPSVIELAATQLLSFGIGKDASGCVIIRCGAMGAYAATLGAGVTRGWWTPAYWTSADTDAVVDVTGAGNAFLGGLSAGLYLSNGNVREATFYATVSSSYIIQQLGLPRVEYRGPEMTEFWNGDRPQERLFGDLVNSVTSYKMPKHFVSLGLFILDEFEFLDTTGKPTGKTLPTQIGGGGTYAAIGARIWLPASEIGQIVDRGVDFPTPVQQELDHYGSEMWYFRDQSENKTTRAVNRYTGELRDFDYLTPRIRLTPKDLPGTPLESPLQIHFVCSPTRAAQIMHDADTHGEKDWKPFTIYEPIPFRCVPEELPALKQILHRIDILSPNAEEALGLLSIDRSRADDPSIIEHAAAQFLSFGIGKAGSGHAVIRCGAMGAYTATLEAGVAKGWWTPAYWTPANAGAVVDVTGAGNAFLGGLSAGLYLSNGDVREAILYATVSAAYTIQQLGLPRVEYTDPEMIELWNGDRPQERLVLLRRRCAGSE